ncbi:DUF4365 domain-containing protein [Deinococcus aquaticus]|uniref:DUF4365 domain-containing protein n=1 Tax=Deinococcus aquaticus TaxID=328692 RepID=UPI003F4898DE
MLKTIRWQFISPHSQASKGLIVTRGKTGKQGRIGVNAVERIVIEELDWVFREQPIDDIGIDAIVEIFDDSRSTGILLGLQIKSGKSWFKEETLTGDGFIYRASDPHYKYWNRLKIPVIILFHDPISREVYWIGIDEKIAESTGKNWKITVPYINIFDIAAKAAILKFSNTHLSPGDLRLGRLRADKFIMQDLARGSTKFIIEAERWINKTHGRTGIKVILEKNGVAEVIQNMQLYPAGIGIEDVIKNVFPWARFYVDEQFYHESDLETLDQEWGIYDKEEGKYVDFSDGTDFKYLRSNSSNLRPYACLEGEVDKYRLVGKLNPLGKSFLLVDSYCYPEDPSYFEDRKG